MVITNDKVVSSEKAEELKPATTASNPAPLPDNPIKQAQDILDKLIIENKKAQELLDKNEAAVARIMLSGRAAAGTTAPSVETEQERIKREAREMFKGTGLDPFK